MGRGLVGLKVSFDMCDDVPQVHRYSPPGLLVGGYINDYKTYGDNPGERRWLHP